MIVPKSIGKGPYRRSSDSWEDRYYELWIKPQEEKAAAEKAKAAKETK